MSKKVYTIERTSKTYKIWGVISALAFLLVFPLGILFGLEAAQFCLGVGVLYSVGATMGKWWNNS